MSLITSSFLQSSRLGLQNTPIAPQQRNKTPPNMCPRYDTKQSDCRITITLRCYLLRSLSPNSLFSGSWSVTTIRFGQPITNIRHFSNAHTIAAASPSMRKTALSYDLPPGRFTEVCVIVILHWWWGSNNAGALRNVEYPFIAIILRFTLTWSGSIW